MSELEVYRSDDVKNDYLEAGRIRAPYRLAQILDVVHYLDGGHPVTKLLPVIRDVHAISIGHMISTMFKREIISRQTFSPHQVVQIIAENLEPYAQAPSKDGDSAKDTIIPAGDPGPTRCMVINALFRSGLVTKGVSLRQLRPLGFTPQVPDVASLIEQKTNLNFKADICSRKRGRVIISARFRTIWVMRRVCGFSLTMIGNSLGDRDHTTILNGLNRIMIDRESHAATRDETDMLCERADLRGVMNGFARSINIEKRKSADLLPRRAEMKT